MLNFEQIWDYVIGHVRTKNPKAFQGWTEDNIRNFFIQAIAEKNFLCVCSPQGEIKGFGVGYIKDGKGYVYYWTAENKFYTKELLMFYLEKFKNLTAAGIRHGRDDLPAQEFTPQRLERIINRL